MSFDENPPSPTKMIDPRKADTKINIGMVVGVVAFLVFGAGALYFFSLAAR
jgi:hypothetical protein